VRNMYPKWYQVGCEYPRWYHVGYSSRRTLHINSVCGFVRIDQQVIVANDAMAVVMAPNVSGSEEQQVIVANDAMAVIDDANDDSMEEGAGAALLFPTFGEDGDSTMMYRLKAFLCAALRCFYYTCT
jgi:hypothetical protein